jgi:ribosome-binding factor A
MATKGYPRATRVAQQIQRTLSELIRRELRDPRLGMITLTDVRMANDLSYAKVYYSVLGADPHLAGEILVQAADMLRGPLGRSLGLRHSPQLRFVQDELIERGARLSGLINQAVKSDVARHVDEPEPAADPADAQRDDQADDQVDDQADAHYNSDDDDSQDSGGAPPEPKL